jgi:ankyrin repeat protein
METLETLLACIYPEAGSEDSDSEDEGVCSLTGCVGDIAILDEGIIEEARRPDAVEMKELTAWSRERLNKLKRHRAEARKLRSVLLRFREKTRKPSKPHTARYEDAVAAGWRALSLDGAELMPLLSTISRAELDHEATLAATRLGKPFEKPGPNIREGLDYVDLRGDGVLHVRIANWYRARAKRDHAKMKQMELEVGALLVAGAPTEVKNDEGLTPLLQACKYDAGTIVRVLIAAEAEFQQVQNAQKLRPLLLAAQENSPTAFEVVADALREKGVLASAARRPGNGYTALHFAAIADAADLIKRAGRFDEFRKSVDVLSSEGDVKTGALHKCAMYGHLESMKALLELGADVDLRDSNGATALHVAALAARFEKDRRHKACVDLLLRHGASIDVADGRGRLLRDLPTSNNVKRVLKRSTTLPVAEKENATGQVKRASSAPISLRA